MPFGLYLSFQNDGICTKVGKSAPISVSTSQGWDSNGADSWSTFAIQVGTPAQTARVIFSSAGYQTWIVDPQGCPEEYQGNCAHNRGGIVEVENSTSWSYIDVTTLALETNLEYEGNGKFGYDEVTLGYPTSGGMSMRGILASIASPDFWLRQIGFDPAPSNFKNLNSPQPSFMWNLVDQAIIPSTLWSYTAGAAYRYNKVQGSLTLGGYDSSHFSPENNFTFPFYNEVGRRLIIDLRTIDYVPNGVSTITKSETLMTGGISIYIDSTIPFIYLPTTVCDRFAVVFGHEWDDANQIYTVNNTMHTKLKEMDPKFIFTAANTAGQTLDIVLPYAAFDLKASFPIIPIDANATNLFPLRRAANDTQYTLGRSFLQEAYLIADYGRKEFTLAPCAWPSTFTQNLVAIYPPSNTTSTLTDNINKNTDTPKDPTSPSKPIGPIIGGVVGGVVVLLILVFLGFFCIYKPRRDKKSSEGNPTTAEEEALPHVPGSNVINKAELDTVKYGETEGPDYDEAALWREAERKRAAAELSGISTPVVYHELDSNVPVATELHDTQSHRGSELPDLQIHEKPT